MKLPKIFCKYFNTPTLFLPIFELKYEGIFFQKQFRFTPCFSPISERTPHTERMSADHEKIQHTAPQPGSQDTHDRGRICRVCPAAFFLQHEPSRVYPASHNRGAIRPIITVSPVNDELLAAGGKLTAEYGRIGGNLNQIGRTASSKSALTLNFV